MATDINGLVARLKAAEAALGDPLGVPRSTRAFEEYWRSRRAFADTVGRLMNAPSDLARAQARLDDVEARHREHQEKRDELDAQIAGFIDWRVLTDARQRDAEWERQWNVRRALERLKEGSLWKNPDTSYEPISYLDQRVRELTEKRDRAAAALASALEQAELLLSTPAASAPTAVTK